MIISVGPRLKTPVLEARGTSHEVPHQYPNDGWGKLYEVFDT